MRVPRRFHRNVVLYSVLFGAVHAAVAQDEADERRLTTLAASSVGRPQSDAEEALLRAATAGEWADARSGDDSLDDPLDSAVWDDDRLVRAELLRWLCIDPRAQTMIDPKGIQLVGVRVDGVLDLTGVTVPFGLCFEACAFTDQIVLEDATVPRLVLDGSHIMGLNGNGLTVASNILMRGVVSRGAVQLVHATVGRDLDCRGAQLLLEGTGAAPKQDALIAEGLTVNGRVYLCADSATQTEFRADREINLINASIGGKLNLSGGQFVRLQLENAEVGTSMDLRGATVTVKVNLAGTRVGTLYDDEDVWFDPPPEYVYLDGFEYDAFGADPTVSVDARARIRWIQLAERMTAHDSRDQLPSEKVKEQPYTHLATLYRSQGDEWSARQVESAQFLARLRRGSSTAGDWLVAIMSTPTWFGAYPLLLPICLIAVYVAGVVAFWFGHRLQAIRHAGPATDAEPHGGGFHACLYSLDVLLPIANLHEAEQWRPCARWARWYVALHIIVGWYFTTVLALMIVDLLRF